jgi:hypothetical protein
MKRLATVAAIAIGISAVTITHAQPAQKPLDRLRAMLEIMRAQLYRTRLPRYVTGYRLPHKTGDFLPFVGDDVGVLEADGKTIVISVFTANHFGSGEALENAIGLVARDAADYFAYRR